MKKLLSLGIAICLLCGLLVNVSAVSYGEELKNAPVKSYKQKFSDVPETHWAFNYIAEMLERGVLSGYPDGKFYPDSQVTRAEFAKIMTTAAGFSVTKPTAQLFADVQISQWYAPYVHTAKEYLSAYSQGGASYYLPNTPALREDIAVALVKLKGYSTTGADLSMLERMFSDYQSISENAKIYVATAIENELISGYNDGTFKGQNSITRAEAATLLWRAYQYGNANKNYDNLEEMPSDNEVTHVDDTEVEEEKKPYTMQILAEASVENINLATLDNDGNIYYIDSSNNLVYVIDTETGNKTKYLETNDFSYSETKIDEDDSERVIESEYTSFVPVQVFYDNINDKLLLSGYYDELTESFKAPEENVEIPFIYDISNKKAPKMYSHINDRYDSYWIQTALNSKKIVVSSGIDYILDINDGSLSEIYMEFSNYWKEGIGLYTQNMECISGMMYNNRLFSFSGGSICEYDFNQDSYEEITDVIKNRKAFGLKDDSYYFWDSEQIFKISVTNGKTTVLDINTDNSNVDFGDMSNLNYIDYKFFVVDDNTIIFYDTNMEAFRILKKN